jgi:hypothetical protein
MSGMRCASRRFSSLHTSDRAEPMSVTAFVKEMHLFFEFLQHCRFQLQQTQVRSALKGSNVSS